MGDEIPEAERTVIVEEANLLRAQIEHSEEQAVEGDEPTQKYHEQRAEYTKKWADQIEGDGVSEGDVEEALDDHKQTVEETEPGTDERLDAEAKFDTVLQVHERYFDGGPDVVEVEAIQSMGYGDGTVEFRDASAKAVISFPDETDARAAADTILDCNGVEDEAARVGMR